MENVLCHHNLNKIGACRGGMDGRMDGKGEEVRRGRWLPGRKKVKLCRNDGEQSEQRRSEAAGWGSG